MVRALTSNRNLSNLPSERAKVAASVSYDAVTVVITRKGGGDGLHAPKDNNTVVSTFTARLNESRPANSRNTVNNGDGYQVARVYTYITALRDNDAVDGVTGNPVVIARTDTATVTDSDNFVRVFTVGPIQVYRGHIEAELIGKA